MSNVFDTAAYILENAGQMTAMKLQKLVYYSQAWALVWDDEPIFKEQIEAWANGPVVRQLYARHKGQYQVTTISEGNPQKLSSDHKETIDIILKEYGGKTSQWLSDLTHKERPWRKARERAKLADGERGNAPITHESMYEYYNTL